MPKNIYLIKENYKKVEEVRKIENEIPSYEEFLNNYNQEQINYEDLTYENISSSKGFGPCSWGNSNCECYLSEGFIPLYVGCSTSYCSSMTSTSWFHAGGYNASSSKNTSCGALVISRQSRIKCFSCGTENNWNRWQFACSNHPTSYNSFDRSKFMNSLSVYGNLIKGDSYIKRTILERLITNF